MSNKMQHNLDYIARSFYMFRALSVPIIRSTVTVVDSHWYNICYVSEWVLRYSPFKNVQSGERHITMVELELNGLYHNAHYLT
jgi:hypothetical protein